MHVPVGESAKLSCNASLTLDTMWTYYNVNVDDGYVRYVYWNGRIDRNYWPQFIMEGIRDHFHIFNIVAAQPKHSGLYECFDENGARKAGYRLIIVGMRSLVVIVCNLRYSAKTVITS